MYVHFIKIAPIIKTFRTHQQFIYNWWTVVFPKMIIKFITVPKLIDFVRFFFFLLILYENFVWYIANKALKAFPKETYILCDVLAQVQWAIKKKNTIIYSILYINTNISKMWECELDKLLPVAPTVKWAKCLFTFYVIANI